jgi:Holliday junction resolvase-like predicted endonuclease
MKKATSLRKIERKLKGHKAFERGILFEVKVGNWLSEKGYKTSFRKKSKRYGEVDIIATKRKHLLGKEILFVECKDKEKITVKDFIRFVKKFESFLRKEPDAKGLFAYRGNLEEDAKIYYNSQLRDDLYEKITLKKWR